MSDDSQDRLEEAMEEALKSVLQREEETTSDNGTSPPEEEAPPPEEKASPAEASPPPATPTESSEEVSEIKDKHLRLAADFENFRKRARRDQQEARQFGTEKLLGDLLPALDNLARALSHGVDESNPVLQGVLMVSKQFTDILSNYGVTSFDSLNETFDPEKHEAIGQVPTPDVPLGCVAEEIQKGYFLHGRLIRPAQVIVAIAPISEPESEPEAEPEAETEAESEAEDDSR